MSELILEGVDLMVMGMGTVFVFLSILVIGTSIMSQIIMRLPASKEIEVSRTKSRRKPAEDLTEIAAVAAAATAKLAGRVARTGAGRPDRPHQGQPLHPAARGGPHSGADSHESQGQGLSATRRWRLEGDCHSRKCHGHGDARRPRAGAPRGARARVAPGQR